MHPIDDAGNAAHDGARFVFGQERLEPPVFEEGMLLRVEQTRHVAPQWRYPVRIFFVEPVGEVDEPLEVALRTDRADGDANGGSNVRIHGGGFSLRSCSTQTLLKQRIFLIDDGAYRGHQF